MIIDFNKLPLTVLPNFKGGELDTRSHMHVDGDNKIMLGNLEPGASIGYHTHELNSEIIFLLHGEGTVITDQGEEKLLPGQVHYCPRGHSHSLINRGTGTLAFVAVVPEHDSVSRLEEKK